MTIASVDPGKHACGVALWDHEGILAWAGYVKNPFKTEPGVERVGRWGQMGNAVVEEIFSRVIPFQQSGILLVLEIPQVYSGFQEEDANDLIDLAGVQGAIVGRSGCSVEWSPQPREWKGQLPKEISEKRVEAKLKDAEKARIDWPAKSLKHNVYDALHLGIVFLEREGLRDFAK